VAAALEASIMVAAKMRYWAWIIRFPPGHRLLAMSMHASAFSAKPGRTGAYAGRDLSALDLASGHVLI
jgi:hypothetical protein